MNNDFKNCLKLNDGKIIKLITIEAQEEIRGLVDDSGLDNKIPNIKLREFQLWISNICD